MNDGLEAKFDLSSAAQSWELSTSTINELAVSRHSPERIDASLPVPQEYVAVHTAENAAFYEACQAVGIYSTSARPDNQAMWAYYCDSSKGVCFELEWPYALLKTQQLCPASVNYTDRARLIDRAEDGRLLMRELAAENPSWSIRQLMAFSMTDTYLQRLSVRTIARATSIKHPNWQHESEIRILAPKPGPRPLLKAILKRVFFMRTDFPEWGPIMTTLYQLYPGVEPTLISFSHAEPLTRVKGHEFRTVHLSELE